MTVVRGLFACVGFAALLVIVRSVALAVSGWWHGDPPGTWWGCGGDDE